MRNQFLVDIPMRLDRFLTQKFPEVSRSRVAKWIISEYVTVDGKKSKPSQMLKAGQNVELTEILEPDCHYLEPTAIPLEVLFEDEFLLVVNKPRGLATHPAKSLKEPSLVNALLARGNELSTGSAPYRPGIVHRLDKDTTGLLVVAKNDLVHTHLARQIQTKTAVRKYLAVLQGEVEHSKIEINAAIARDPKNRLRMAISDSGKPAVTHLRRLNFFNVPIAQGLPPAVHWQKFPIATFAELQLETGRTHQIRVHVAALGHPVVGDTLYGQKGFSPWPLQLHATFLSFDHPVTCSRIEVKCEPPKDFLAIAT